MPTEAVNTISGTTPTKSIESTVTPPRPEVAAAAQDRADTYGDRYAKASTGISGHPGISGNKKPNETELTWLKDRSKCNQFVGDSLTDAGYTMPTFRMADGSVHYMNAEKLPNQKGYFEKVTSLSEVRPGDLIVIDYPKSGENGAHVEIVTDINPASRDLTTIGARSNGALEGSAEKYLPKKDSAGTNGGFVINNNVVYFLRPTKSSGQ